MIDSAHLDRAEYFISTGSEEDLVHAALELRLAIEQHVYRKLRFYATRHGEKLLFAKWQPNKAIKLLCQLEPYADMSYTLSFAEEKQDGNPKGPYTEIGKHEALTAAWIAKNYHKLGSYLHLDPLSAALGKVEREYAREVASEMKRVAKGSLICSIAETISFKCTLCDSKITCCKLSLPNIDEVVCQNPSCSATFSPQQTADEWEFRPNDVDFQCRECKQVSFVLLADLQIGTKVTCKHCQCRYIISEHNWGLTKVGG